MPEWSGSQFTLIIPRFVIHLMLPSLQSFVYLPAFRPFHRWDMDLGLFKLLTLSTLESSLTWMKSLSRRRSWSHSRMSLKSLPLVPSRQSTSEVPSPDPFILFRTPPLSPIYQQFDPPTTCPPYSKLFPPYHQKLSTTSASRTALPLFFSSSGKEQDSRRCTSVRLKTNSLVNILWSC